MITHFTGLFKYLYVKFFKELKKAYVPNNLFKNILKVTGLHFLKITENDECAEYTLFCHLSDRMIDKKKWIQARHTIMQCVTE